MSPAPRAVRRSVLVTLVAVVLSATACSPKDAPLPPGATKNEEFKFAIVPPPGWILVTPKTADDHLAVYGDRAQDAFRFRLKHPVTGKTRYVLSYVKTDAPDDFLPHISVVFNSVGLPQVTEVERDKSRQALAAKFVAHEWQDAVEESADIIDVDRRKAVRVVYSGVVFSTPAGDRSKRRAFKIRFVEAMIPARNFTHFVSLTAEEAQFDRYLETFNRTLESFRSFGDR